MLQDRKREDFIMKKTYKIDVDCANCANKMEDAAKKTAYEISRCDWSSDVCSSDLERTLEKLNIGS